jgi:hypothetical protein
MRCEIGRVLDMTISFAASTKSNHILTIRRELIKPRPSFDHLAWVVGIGAFLAFSMLCHSSATTNSGDSETVIKSKPYFPALDDLLFHSSLDRCRRLFASESFSGLNWEVDLGSSANLAASCVVSQLSNIPTHDMHLIHQDAPLIALTRRAIQSFVDGSKWALPRVCHTILFRFLPETVVTRLPSHVLKSETLRFRRPPLLGSLCSLLNHFASHIDRTAATQWINLT